MENKENKKAFHTHLAPKKEEVREVDEAARSWADFYNGSKLPIFQRHNLK